MSKWLIPMKGYTVYEYIRNDGTFNCTLYRVQR